MNPCVADRRAHGSPFALVHLVTEQADAGLGGSDLAQNVPRSVAGAIVNDHEFPFQVFGERRVQDGLQTAPDHGALIVDGDQNTKEQVNSIPMAAGEPKRKPPEPPLRVT